MTDAVLDRLIASGFWFAMVMFGAAIAIRLAHYLATTNAPWV